MRKYRDKKSEYMSLMSNKEFQKLLKKRRCKIIGIITGLIIFFSTAIIFFRNIWKVRDSETVQIHLNYWTNESDINYNFTNTNITYTGTNNITDIKTNHTNNTDNTNHYYEANLVNGNLYWKDERVLDQVKIREEIKIFAETHISFDNQSDFIRRENPLVTLVITIYNQQDYIKRVYYSIQRQNLKDIEIIFVDDASTDNSTKIVEELMENDKRIVLYKNDRNRRAFYSRNKGILHARGEYILVIDPDDIILNNILYKAYTTAKDYNLDICQFYIMMGYFDKSNARTKMKYKGGILRGNPEIRNIFYNGVSKNICDKLIRREVYIKSVNFMKEEYYDGDYHINDDDTAFFGIIHYAESFGFLEQIGYFYIARPPGPNHYRVALNRTNDLIFSICNVMRYFYGQSENNTLEKVNVAYKYFQKSFKEFGNRIKYLTEGFDFILDSFDIYLNSSFFDNNQKTYIKSFNSKIIDRKNQIVPQNQTVPQKQTVPQNQTSK